MKRKGISLPVEMIVIIALAVIVLLAAGAFFAINFIPGQATTEDFSAWERGCSIWKLRGCSSNINPSEIIVTGYDYNKDNKDDSALDACKRALSTSNAQVCFETCCAPGSTMNSGTQTGSSDDDRTTRDGDTRR